MKRFLPLLLFVSIVFPQKEYNIKQIIERDSIYYKKFSDEVVNGRIYEMRDDIKVSLGKMKDGKKDGQGTYIWSNDDKYIGEFKENKQHGKGTLTYVSGKIYSGKYRNGKLQKRGKKG